MSLCSGARLGPYELLSHLGTGGMGEVWRARELALERDVALKVLPEEFVEDKERVDRFGREAKLLAALNHPNIATIHAFEEISGRHVLVMEFIDGTTMRDRLDAGPISQRDAVEYALQFARSLSAAHDKGIVHRDLKPENLFVTKDGRIKILDFGLAKKTERVRSEDETSAPTVSKHTEPGTVMGTVNYMSPEQVKGQVVDQRSDIFSFGAILYELLSGKKAFRRDSAAETMAAILLDEPPDLAVSGKKISPALAHIVRHCLEKEPLATGCESRPGSPTWPTGFSYGQRRTTEE